MNVFKVALLTMGMSLSALADEAGTAKLILDNVEKDYPIKSLKSLSLLSSETEMRPMIRRGGMFGRKTVLVPILKRKFSVMDKGTCNHIVSVEKELVQADLAQFYNDKIVDIKSNCTRVNVLSPNGLEVFLPEQQHKITWTFQGRETNDFRITIGREGTLDAPPGRKVILPGQTEFDFGVIKACGDNTSLVNVEKKILNGKKYSLDWKVGTHVSGNSLRLMKGIKYEIRVQSCAGNISDDTSLYDVSDAGFSIGVAESSPSKTKRCSIYADFNGKNGTNKFYFVNNEQKTPENCMEEFNKNSGDVYVNTVKSICKDQSNYLGGNLTYYLKYEIDGKVQSPIYGDYTCM